MKHHLLCFNHAKAFLNMNPHSVSVAPVYDHCEFVGCEKMADVDVYPRISDPVMYGFVC